MEPYHDAFLARDKDVGWMHDYRKVGAAKAGGAAVECLLKYMIVDYHQISAWGTTSLTDGSTIRNISNHDLAQMVQQIAPLSARVNMLPDVLHWINTVRQPVTTIPEVRKYVDLRYQGENVLDSVYQDWYDAYTKLVEWLLDQPEYQ